MRKVNKYNYLDITKFFEENIIMKNNVIKLILIFLIFLSVSVVSAESLNIFGFKNNKTLNFVQITDVHLDNKTNNSSKRMFEYSADLLKDAVSQVNNLKDAQFVVFSGDVVNRSNKDLFSQFINIANCLNIPWYYLPGNHDVGIFGGVSKREIKKIMSANMACPAPDSLYYSYSPNKNFLMIFLDGVITNEITANGYFPKQELDWLDKQIKCNRDKKIVIVQHFPVVEPYHSYTHYTRNVEEYFKIIDKYSNVIAVLSGHYHAAKITLRKNVLHISTPSLIEYPNAFRQIKITLLNDGTKFDIKLIETGLKDVRNISKSRSNNPSLEEGKESDRNAVIIIKTAEPALKK